MMFYFGFDWFTGEIMISFGLVYAAPPPSYSAFLQPEYINIFPLAFEPIFVPLFLVDNPELCR